LKGGGERSIMSPEGASSDADPKGSNTTKDERGAVDFTPGMGYFYSYG
jgi:hypothetical protein